MDKECDVYKQIVVIVNLYYPRIQDEVRVLHCLNLYYITINLPRSYNDKRPNS